jgi:diaminohydroxyphosphoribosylaminopyrimidine deaminase/5-amino-6-(5-phosphoribosylamino)uracil reductase
MITAYSLLKSKRFRLNENDIDKQNMQRALDLAESGLGMVEPNPPVGCVIALGKNVIAEGCHQHYGGRHAEVNALENVPPEFRNELSSATLYVSLEPCCHHGKTPPCVSSILRSGIRRVVVAVRDPNPVVSGKGIKALLNAGITVEIGIGESQAKRQLAPYIKLVKRGIPWVIAKWAMTLDGKIATRNHDSQWISSPESRRIVHDLRGRMDAIIVGIGTALTDDPLLTARPPGPRTATRIVLDSMARLPIDSQLARTIGEAPVLVVVGPGCDEGTVEKLRNAGLDVYSTSGTSAEDRSQCLLEELGRRRMTSIMVEGGATVLGTLFDADYIDEVHAFVAPKLAGGLTSPTPIAGHGIPDMQHALTLEHVIWQQVDEDIYLRGFVPRVESE